MCYLETLALPGANVTLAGHQSEAACLVRHRHFRRRYGSRVATDCGTQWHLQSVGALPLGTARLLFVSLDLMNMHEYDASYNIRKYLLCVFSIYGDFIVWHLPYYSDCRYTP